MSIQRAIYTLHRKHCGLITGEKIQSQLSCQQAAPFAPRPRPDERLELAGEGPPPKFIENVWRERCNAIENSIFFPADAGPEFGQQTGFGECKRGLTNVVICGGMRKKNHG